VDFQTIFRAVEAGQLGERDIVWKEGMPDWKPIRDVPELQAALTSRAAALRAPAAASTVTPGYASPNAAQPLAYQNLRSDTGLVVSSLAIEMLRQTKPWVRFVSVMLFVNCGLIVLAAMFVMLAGVAGGSVGGGRGMAMGAGVGLFVALFYAVIGLIPLFMGIYLSRYANNIKALLDSSQGVYLEKALEAQKAFWRLVGIVLLVTVCIYGVILLILLLGLLASLA
jgi:hypothetical protein